MRVGRYLRLLHLVIVLLALAGGRPVAAAPVVLVASERGSTYDDAAAALRSSLRPTLSPHEVQVLNWRELSTANLDGSRVIVTIGSDAARAVNALTPSAPVLHTLLPRSVFERLARPSGAEDRISAIYLDQPAQRQIRLIRQALPDWTHLALISGPRDPAVSGQLAAAARADDLTVREARVTDDSQLYPALQNVLAEPAVLLALPDAAVFNAYTIQNVLLTAYRYQSPVIGFSPAYVRAGALLALYSTPAQIGRQAAAAVRTVLAGGGLPPPQGPSEFEVGVNTSVARSLGISLAPADVLTARLLRQEKAP